VLTTLYCDASFCPYELVGGWGIWLRSNRGRHVESGRTPDFCTQSNHAEFAAVYAGLYRAVTKWPETTAVLVVTDCAEIVRVLESDKVYQSVLRRMKKRIDELRTQHQIRIVPRWVKGHRQGSQVDIYLNNQVDELARQVMAQEREARGFKPPKRKKRKK